MKKIFGVGGIVVGLAVVGAGIWFYSSVGTLGTIVIVLMGASLCIVGLSAFMRSNRQEPQLEESEREKPEYRRNKQILSRAEWEFLQILYGVINQDKYTIHVQVPLVAVIDKITQNSYRNELFRVVDYLIVDSVTYSPLLFIELNDASHQRADRMERDRKVNEICDAAKMPIVTFDTKQSRDIPYIKKTILKSILKK